MLNWGPGVRDAIPSSCEDGDNDDILMSLNKGTCTHLQHTQPKTAYQEEDKQKCMRETKKKRKNKPHKAAQTQDAGTASQTIIVAHMSKLLFLNL